MTVKKNLLIISFFIASGSTIMVNAAAVPKAEKKAAVVAVEKRAILLPSSDVLKKRLTELGLQHFADKTEVHITLGDQEKYAVSVNLVVNMALQHYTGGLKNAAQEKIMETKKSEILKALLRDSPAGLAELVKIGVLTA